MSAAIMLFIQALFEKGNSVLISMPEISLRGRIILPPSAGDFRFDIKPCVIRRQTKKKEFLRKNEKSRKIIGFDIFGQFPSVGKVSSDTEFVKNWNIQFEGEFVSKREIESSLDNKNLKNVELVQGDILETLDGYLKEHPYTRIALLHIDTDVYEPAKAGLEKLYDRVVRGGIIVFDDFGVVEGETKAMEDFFADKDYDLKKFCFSHTKPSYIVKNN